MYENGFKTIYRLDNENCNLESLNNLREKLLKKGEEYDEKGQNF